MFCSLFQRRDTMKESRENRSLWYLLRLKSLADEGIGNDSQCDEKEWDFLTPGPEKKLTALRERWKIEVEGDNLGISQFLYPAPLAEPGKEEKKNREGSLWYPVYRNVGKGPGGSRAWVRLTNWCIQEVRSQTALRGFLCPMWWDARTEKLSKVVMQIAQSIFGRERAM